VLLGAAAESSGAYRLWLRYGESEAYRRFELAHPRTGVAIIHPLIFVEPNTSLDQVQRSLRSIRDAFGEGVQVHIPQHGLSGRNEIAAQDGVVPLSSVSKLGPGWLLPVTAGDQLASPLKEVLERSLVGTDSAVVFWDEDRLNNGVREDPWIKPKWDPYLFSVCSGLVGSCVVSTRVLHEVPSDMAVPMDRAGLETWLVAWLSRHEEQCVHIPLVLSHRARPLHVSAKPRPPLAAAPSVTILIPTRDRSDVLGPCLRSLNDLSYPGPVEILLIDNGTVEPAALEIIDGVERAGRAKVIRVEGTFNFSRLNNIGAEVATGEVLCLLNNDIEALDGDWLAVMVRHCLEKDVGVVGAQLVYPDRRIQHAGVVIGLGGAAGHVQKGVKVDDQRFGTWHRVTREVSAVTAAAMVLRKRTFLDTGGFDEVAFPVAFNDVDLCLRVKKAGLRNLYVAEARLIHHESVSRGEDRSPEKARRFAGELKQLQDRWGTIEFEDPHFSPLFSKAVERCMLRT
jgi:GT2 family glycosyltransferase